MLIAVCLEGGIAGKDADAAGRGRAHPGRAAEPARSGGRAGPQQDGRAVQGDLLRAHR